LPNGVQLCVRVAGVVRLPSTAAARRTIMTSGVRPTGLRKSTPTEDPNRARVRRRAKARNKACSAAVDCVNRRKRPRRFHYIDKKSAFAEPASKAEDPAYTRVTGRRSVSALVPQANREPEACLTWHGSSSAFARSSFRSRKASGSELMLSHVGHGLRRSSGRRFDSAGARCRRTLRAVPTKTGLPRV
jgi:hypothetical protein